MELNMKYRYNAITGEMCKQDFPETHAENIIIFTNNENVVFWDKESDFSFPINFKASLEINFIKPVLTLLTFICLFGLSESIIS